MATSNREYVGRALEALARALDPFIERVVSPHLPEGITDWVSVVQAKDAGAGKNGGTYERSDPQLQLRIITEPMGPLAYIFNGVLSRTEQGYAGELRSVSNDWAHNKPFTGDQARRALETIELLLRPAGAVREADSVRRMRLEIQRAEFERDTRQSTKAAAVTSNVADSELPSWREVLTPHPDVASGGFASSEFAADLYRVAVRDVKGQEDAAPTEYSDAIEFFRRTYLTDGLRELLQRSAARLAGNPNADAVINLQTTFGGGKTHSMLAVWHLFSGRPLHEFPQDVQDVLVGHHEDVIGNAVKRVTIVGNEIAPGQPSTKPDGTVVNTLWGEIAWQLGEQAGDAAGAYSYVAEADSTGTNPGGALRDLFAVFGPAVILIDEWVSYARQLNTRRQIPDGTTAPLPAGAFETQFTFAQSLTQAAAAVPGTLLPSPSPRVSGRGRTTTRTVHRRHRTSRWVEPSAARHWSASTTSCAASLISGLPPPGTSPTRSFGAGCSCNQVPTRRGRSQWLLASSSCSIRSTQASSHPTSPARNTRRVSEPPIRCTRNCSTGSTPSGPHSRSSSAHAASCVS